MLTILYLLYRILFFIFFFVVGFPIFFEAFALELPLPEEGTLADEGSNPHDGNSASDRQRKALYKILFFAIFLLGCAIISATFDGAGPSMDPVLHIEDLNLWDTSISYDVRSDRLWQQFEFQIRNLPPHTPPEIGTRLEIQYWVALEKIPR